METAALSFERAWVLNALWLLPLVLALFWWSEQRRRTAIGRIVAPKLRALLAGNASPLRRWFRSACVIGALALLIGALAGPRLGYDTLEVPHRGRDVIIAVDVSRSMLAQDIPPSRLDRAKLFAEDLVSELGGDRIGLVAFAGSAFLQAPLTLDHGAVLTAVDELDTAVIPKGGTNLDAAISTADEAFGKAEGFSRAIVIVSDGEELSADGVAAARNASRQGVRIFTVGVGSPEGSEIPDGIGEFIRDPDTSKVVTSKLDEARMKEIAEATGGFYTRLDDGAAALIATEGIGKMAESDITANSSRRPIERYQWPLGAAIALLMLQSLVGERRRRPIAAAIAAFVLLSPAAWAGPAGIEAYDQGDFEKAREAFESRLRMEPESPGLQLNAGTAAYRLKDYAKASQYFSRASLSDDAAIRSAAEYNFANTLFRQGEGQQDKEKKITDWKEAIAKYDAALKTRPDYEEAKENKERVEQLLKELEKEQKQEKQDQQQENDQKQDQQQKDQDQKQDQQKQDQKQDQQKQDQKDQQQQDQNQQQQQGGGQQDQEQKEEQNKQNQSGSGSGSGQEKKDQQNQEQKENKQDEQQQEGQNKDQEQKDSQQKKDQQLGGQGQQDHEKKDGGQGEGEKKDDQQQQGGQKEGEQKDQENKQDKQDQGAQQKEQEKSGGEPGEEKKDEGREDGKEEQKPSPTGDSRPQSGQSGDERGPVPQQSQEKKEGEVRGAGQPQGGKEEEGGTPAAALEEEEDGKMNESQARALLRALQNEEGKVDLLEREVFQDVSKDW
jgi:Ca-activated chloride channel family protein